MSMVIKRGIVVAIGLAMQILLFLLFYLYLGDHIFILNVIYHLFGILLVLWIIKNSKSYSYDLPWINCF